MSEKEKIKTETEAFVIEVLSKVPKGDARERVLELAGLAAVMATTQSQAKEGLQKMT